MAENDGEIFTRLGRIEQMCARIDERTKCLDDHEKRIRALEDKDSRRGGVLAALTTVGSAIGAAITWIVHHVTAGGAQ